jgi:crossover junction endodeoxyribonuclease RusA
MTTITVLAPELKPVRKRATGKLTTPSPWLNANDHNLHPIARANLTEQWRKLACSAADGTPTYPKPIHITCHIWKPRRGRYDPGNLYPTAKACVDGLVDAGLTVDDDWLHVIGPDMRHGGIGPAALVFTIEPAKTS